jgi:outer membrane protein OmpA-like peptidoglycan-associated protein
MINKRSVIKITMLAILLTVSSQVMAQQARKNLAQNYYNRLDYVKAATVYSELADNSLKSGKKKGKSVDWDMVRRAGETSYLSRNYKNAAKYYKELVTSKSLNKDDYMFYFETLRYLGDYKTSGSLIDSLYAVDASNPKVAAYKRVSNYSELLRKDSLRFKVSDLPFNKGVGDFGPAFFEDGMVYATNRRQGNINGKYGWDNLNFLDVYYTKRENGNFAKKGKLQSKKFKTTMHDGPIAFDKDFKTAYITRNRVEKDVKKGDLVRLGLYISERDANGKWGVPQPFAFNSKDYSVGHASLSVDGNKLFFASDMPGTVGGADIWKCEKVAGVWGKPVNLGDQINTPDDELFPYISPENNLYFASRGHVGLGGLDLFESRKGGQSFMMAMNMGYPLNSQYDDFALITENEGKNGFFSSDRKDYIDRIYGVAMASRVLIDAKVVVKNEKDNSVLKNTDVTIRNSTTGDSLVIKTDSTGSFLTPLYGGSEYEFVATLKDFKPVAPIKLSTANVTSSKTFDVELLMIPNKPISLDSGMFVLRVLDCETNKPVVGLEMILVESVTKEVVRYQTDSEGKIKLPSKLNKLPHRVEFTVSNKAMEMDADGKAYRPEKHTVTFTMDGTEPDLTLLKDICTTSMKENDAIVLEDIFYDYNKATLREISIVQLDKAYNFLVKNPNARIQLSSHTDSRGSAEYNMSLSDRRAKSCVDFLTQKRGIDPSRLEWKGYGESQLLNNCKDGVKCSEAEHQLNRRTEVRVLKIN